MQSEIKVGCYVLRLPIRYTVKDAKPEDKEVYQGYKLILENLVENGSGGMILPAVKDQDGNYLFDLNHVGPSASENPCSITVEASSLNFSGNIKVQSSKIQSIKPVEDLELVPDKRYAPIFSNFLLNEWPEIVDTEYQEMIHFLPEYGLSCETICFVPDRNIFMVYKHHSVIREESIDFYSSEGVWLHGKSVNSVMDSVMYNSKLPATEFTNKEYLS